MNDTGFEFVDSHAAVSGDKEAVRTIRLPPGISRKRKLLSALATALEFPTYFGHNWDALEELLRDLSWLTPPHTLRLVHRDLPCAKNPSTLAIYLAILQQRVQANAHKASVKLLVSFPRQYEAALQKVLESAE